MAETIRTKSRAQCFLCGSNGKILYQGLFDRYHDTPGLWNMKQCVQDKCALIWLDPAPIDEDLHLAYQTYFTHGTAKGERSFAGGILNILYQTYSAVQYPSSALLGLNSARQKMNSLFLGDLSPGKLLDVGCGDGRFLNGMRKLGWQIDGVDFDARAIASAKAKYGLDLRSGDLCSAKFPDNSFDAITMNHVIEHVPEPLALLEEARRILKPGGRLALTTPNTKSIGHKKFRDFWLGIDAPRHLFLYSPETLAECVTRSKFSVIQAFSTAAHADIFFGGSFSIRDSSNHRTTTQPHLNLSRIIKTMLLQHWEQFQIKSHPDSGEEAVVLSVKEI